ncbi:MAG: DEAD/DEAH box helicase family protein [Ruminococcus sp.]|nr:DEAD/DEAH box helicase family protein [Ruminococcus sp.]
MVQTACRRLKKLNPPSLIITDESHHSKSTSYRRIYDFFPNAYRVGVTATPVRLDGSGLGDVYDTLIEGVSAKWLIENNFLSPYTYYAPTVADLNGIKIQRGEFETKSAENVLFNRTVFGNVINHYQKLADGRQAICYCVSVKHSSAMAEEFQANGISAVHIDGTTPKAERQRIIEDFRNNKVKILCNVDLISEGFDVPDCECAILLRPTKSLTLYIQQSMRCMRYKPEKSAVIIDHVGNYARFGMPDADRQWTLESKPRKARQQAENEVKVLQCPECFYTFQLEDDIKVCPNCNYVFPKKERTLDVEDGAELRQITGFVLKYDDSPDQCRNMQDLQKYAKNHGYKSGWCWYQARQRGWIK